MRSVKNVFYSCLFIMPFCFSIVLGQTATAPSGTGTSLDPYQISSLENLFWIQQNESEWAKIYEQTANIDASGTSSWDGGNGWWPIGYYSGISFVGFEGVYDGKNYEIQNLYINRSSTNYVGLFGVAEGADISNLDLTLCNITGSSEVGALVGNSLTGTNLSNCSSTGSVSGISRVGGLVGLNNASGILASSSSCTVNGSTGGGLVGYNTGASASVIDCYATGNVTGTNSIGGLVGENTTNATISQSSASGSATASNQYAGGLVGDNKATIEKSYATGDATGVSSVGGFIGENYSSSAGVTNCYSRGNVIRSSGTSTDLGGFVGISQSATPTIDNCFSTGSVTYTGDTDPTDKGFIGTFSSGTITDSFWDTQTSGQSTSTAGTGKTTADMKTASTFTSAGWDDTIWNIGDGINDGYAYLDWQNGGGTPLPVELISFEGYNTEEGVLLEWETATEVNNYGFEVERSGDNLLWQIIGFVHGNGTRNSPKSYSFTDPLNLTHNPNLNRIDYRLKQIDNDGAFAYSKTITVDLTTITDVDDEVNCEFALGQNYPNPFNPSTTIQFTVPSVEVQHAQPLQTKLIVYDILGQQVATLVNQKLQPGNHEVNFDASGLASGMYFYRIDVGELSSIKKMILLK